jgi:hypothetical protein
MGERHGGTEQPLWNAYRNFPLTSSFLALRAVLGPIECGAFHAALRHSG